MNCSDAKCKLQTLSRPLSPLTQSSYINTPPRQNNKEQLLEGAPRGLQSSGSSGLGIVQTMMAPGQGVVPDGLLCIRFLATRQYEVCQVVGSGFAGHIPAVIVSLATELLISLVPAV